LSPDGFAVTRQDLQAEYSTYIGLTDVAGEAAWLPFRLSGYAKKQIGPVLL